MGQNMEIDNFLKIERLAENDLPKFIQLIRLFEAVFEMKNFSIPDSEHLQKLLNQNNFYVFVALLENKIVGGLTSYVLEQYYSEKPLAYIYDLAVDTNWQRQGIGKKLITATNQFYTEKGFEEVFVQADKVDDYALDFARSTKPTAEEQVVHFYYTLK
uniref:aminoglycoside acetyltransferase meta-AAC0020 n=1 Tax=uncultured bacterium TaxID=77133 RepID=UPI00097BA4FC|nr:Chain A, aminoglycoside acetyltransferase meta-AAC0020 [uncultured bacterium]5U08_B Chain B, aminoglycoside acetyltransferase meta-AAC0020 [uncultured bacterium]5U08_C Chain C, aminoglycoside acetyltransferase meta-AAC0020 [uncultured bacterium]5U08_D Chain D, aminoglycoside acetyltransferase meta-AAC0020 [uncultured bacterium]